jgi:Arc/MetJ-type ribon-helix-helix transcriptional regulator
MSEDRAVVVRRTFTLTEKDIEILKAVVKKCGYVSDSEALRAIIRFFADRAPCMSQDSATARL